MKPKERASAVYYEKPRPVFWEQLFFGKESPFVALFANKGENYQQSLSSFIFNLDIEIKNDWLGYSKEVLSQEFETKKSHFYSFGVLLAYTYILGIRDLHRYNLIKMENHLQVIDAEVVLTNLVLPHESVLLPFKEVDFSLCALSLLAPSIEVLTEDQKKLILTGYFDLFARVYEKQEEMLRLLNSLTSYPPIRVLLRNTRTYYSHLSGEVPIEDLYEEEKIQLGRGDIPYFFKIIGDNQLYWLKSLEGQKATIKVTGIYQNDVNRHAQTPSVLIGSPESIEKKMAQGALFLFKKLGVTEHYEFLWNGSRLIISSNEYQNFLTGKQFKV